MLQYYTLTYEYIYVRSLYFLLFSGFILAALYRYSLFLSFHTCLPRIFLLVFWLCTTQSGSKASTSLLPVCQHVFFLSTTLFGSMSSASLLPCFAACLMPLFYLSGSIRVYVFCLSTILSGSMSSASLLYIYLSGSMSSVSLRPVWQHVFCLYTTLSGSMYSASLLPVWQHVWY